MLPSTSKLLISKRGAGATSVAGACASNSPHANISATPAAITTGKKRPWARIPINISSSSRQTMVLAARQRYCKTNVNSILSTFQARIYANIVSPAQQLIMPREPRVWTTVLRVPLPCSGKTALAQAPRIRQTSSRAVCCLTTRNYSRCQHPCQPRQIRSLPGGAFGMPRLGDDILAARHDIPQHACRIEIGVTVGKIQRARLERRLFEQPA